MEENTSMLELILRQKINYNIDLKIETKTLKERLLVLENTADEQNSQIGILS